MALCISDWITLRKVLHLYTGMPAPDHVEIKEKIFGSESTLNLLKYN